VGQKSNSKIKPFKVGKEYEYMAILVVLTKKKARQLTMKSLAYSVHFLSVDKKRTHNRRFGNMAGATNIFSTFCSLLGFSSSRRITPGNRKNNELLFINLAAVTG
jgi:hypothetical protein